MKHLVLTLLLFLIGFNTNAQNPDFLIDKQSDGLNENLVSLDILAPGITYERGLSDFNSLVLGVNTGLALFLESSSSGNDEISILVVPVFTGQFRHYYNYNKRNRKLKSTWYNSANFVGFNASYQGSPFGGENNNFIYEEGGVIGPFWGLQRNGTLTFTFLLGVGVYTGSNVVDTFGELKFGLNLTKLFEKE